MIVPVPDAASAGLIVDTPAHRTPIGAWQEASNVRFGPGAACAIEGLQNKFTPPSVPVALFPTPNGLVVASPSAIYYWDGTTVSDISRSGGYTGTEDDAWIGGAFNNFLVITNGVDVPQAIDLNNIAGGCFNLPNWPSTHRAKGIKAFKNYLVAFDITISGTRDIRRLFWSSPADPYTLPASWDVADPATDAGDISLSEGADQIIDAVQVGDNFYIFTENQTWAMQYVGGMSIFAVAKVIDGYGLLAPSCYANVPDLGLVVMAASDIMVVGGKSVAFGRVQKALFSSIDSTYYKRSTVIFLYEDKEIWFLIPEAGSSLLSKAYVWNYQLDCWSTYDLPLVRSAVVKVAMTVFSSETIDSDTETMDGENVILCDSGPSAAKYLRVVYMATDDSVSILSPLEFVPVRIVRKDLAYVQADRIDERNYKRAVAVRLDVEGPSGEVVTVTPGYKVGYSGEMVWASPVEYVIGTSEEAQFSVVGRFVGFKFEWTHPNISLRGYEYEVFPLGQAL